MIYAEKFLKKRYAAGIERGLEQGLERGKTVGIKETNAKWEEWNRRRVEAEANGEEPPPPPDVSNGQ